MKKVIALALLMLYALAPSVFADSVGDCKGGVPFPPTATTDPATNITDNSATLNATVNPNGSKTTVYFEWGTNISYGNSTPPQSIGCRMNDVSVSADITGLSLGTTYHYRVVVTNAHGTSYGNDMSFTTTGAPTGTIQVNATLDGVDWTGAVSYTLSGPETVDGTVVPATFSGKPTGTYPLTYLSGGPLGAALSSISPSDTQTLEADGTITFTMNFISPPVAPSNLTATAISSSQINLLWTDNSNNETGIKIERKTGVDGTYAQIATVGADVTTYSDTGLTPATTYYYRVKAYNSAGDSTYSNEANATTIAFPTATTDSATNITANSATLNATVNPNGSETTVYFEWGIDTSYGNSTPAQSIGSGTDDVSITADITGLSPSTIYHYRVVATNAGGTSYGDDISFTTQSLPLPITLNITSPLDGETINRLDVMVKGTVTNTTTGNETGVVINGIVAVVYNGEFIVNHVPLEEGQNTITATATDTEGYTASTSITVNAASTPHVTLTANIESGIAPLTTYFSVSTEIPNAASTYEMDYEGDGVIDYTGAAFEDISFTYTTEGIYYPTVTVTDTQSITYSDTIAIVVLNQADLDTLLRAKWTAMTNSLSNGDTATALTYIFSGTRTLYEEMFNALIDQWPSIVATQTEFNRISITNNVAKYELVTLENDTTYSYEVIFIKDENGIWMIMEF